MKTLKIIDFSCIKHSVGFANLKSFQASRFKDLGPEDVGSHAEKVVIKMLYDDIESQIVNLYKQEDLYPADKIVLVLDHPVNGKYWRNIFQEKRLGLADLKSPEFKELSAEDQQLEIIKHQQQGYKGHRIKDWNFYTGCLKIASRQFLESFVKRGGSAFSFPLLEADDFVGLLIKYKPQDLEIVLTTLDRDHGQLVSDQKNVKWQNLHYKNYGKVETEKDALKFFTKKLGEKNMTNSEGVVSMSEVVKAKSIKGDVGDNLAKGCDKEVMCLEKFCAPLFVRTENKPVLEFAFPEFLTAHGLVINFYKDNFWQDL